MTPPLVASPGIEPHLHPFKAQGLGPYQQQDEYYLHTSPEFHMKELLSLGFEKIFTLCHSFRHEPHSDWHRPQFLMLEWYRAGERYEELIKDVEELLFHLRDSLALGKKELEIKTMDQIFKEILNFSFLEFEQDKKGTKDFYHKLKSDFNSLPLPPLDDNVFFDDLFYLVFLNLIEPELKAYPQLIIKEYPASQAALSTIKKGEEKVCERFELYLDGIEIANAFNELTCPEEQKKRAERDLLFKEKLYGQKLPLPKVLLSSLERGLPNPSAGIALGVERLLMVLLNKENFPWDI